MNKTIWPAITGFIVFIPFILMLGVPTDPLPFTPEVNFIVLALSIYTVGAFIYLFSRLLFRSYINNFLEWFSGYYGQKARGRIGEYLIEGVYDNFLLSNSRLAEESRNVKEKREDAIASLSFAVAVFISVAIYIFMWYRVLAAELFIGILIVYGVGLLLSMFNYYSVSGKLKKLEEIFTISYFETVAQAERIKAAYNEHMEYGWR